MISGFKVIKSGILSLLQDGGRFGYNHLGLCNGGPMDKEAFRWSNRLCSNPENSGALEVTIGGLVMDAQGSSCVALTGADIPMQINKKSTQIPKHMSPIILFLGTPFECL